MDGNPPGSSVHGISQQEYWSGLPFSPPGDLPGLGIEPVSRALAGRFFTSKPPEKPMWSYIDILYMLGQFPSPGDLPDPGVEPMSPVLEGRFFTTEPPRKPRAPCITS